ncbi:MAG: OmpA family protein [Myxococcota bacterium]
MTLNSLPIAALATTQLVGCVSMGAHQEVVAQYEASQRVLSATEQQLEQARENNVLINRERSKAEERAGQLISELAAAKAERQQLARKVSSMGENVEALVDEKSDLRREIQMLDRMRAASEERVAEYRRVVYKLKRMLDSGKLKTKVRNGRMLLELSNDVLFPARSVELKPEAIRAVEEVARTILLFPDRKFQVIGHSDGKPMEGSDRFPTNWELSSQRAVEVVKVLVGAGVAPESVTAAAAAEFDPVAPNDNEANKALNRRVEIVFVPKVDELMDLGLSSGS